MPEYTTEQIYDAVSRLAAWHKFYADKNSTFAKDIAVVTKIVETVMIAQAQLEEQAYADLRTKEANGE